MFYLNRVVWCWSAVVVVCLFVSLRDAHATVPGQNGKIAFARASVTKGSLSDIVVGNADGSQLLKLTDTPTSDEADPAWSADGAVVAFERRTAPDYTSDIFVVNADGSGEKRLTNFAGNEKDPDWSPDGLQLALSADNRISVMNADGSGLRPIGDAVGITPSWSPDGKHIVFQGVDRDIFVVNVDGSGLTKIADVAYPGSPSWSPDGSKILFAQVADGTNNIFAVNVDGSNPTNVTKYRNPMSGSYELAFYPVWSPDGNQILFVHRTFYGEEGGSEGSKELWVMDANGTNQRVVANTLGFDHFDPAWQPLNASSVRGGCNGTNCSDTPRFVVDNEQKLLNGFKKPVRFAKSGFVVSGKLVNQSGQPILGATIDVLQQVASPGATQTKVSEIKTDANGIWKTTIAGGPSRSIQFAYRAYQKDEKYAAISTVFTQKVSGAVSFKLPKHARRGKKIIASGSLAGGFTPPQGKLLELQVFFKGKYRVFKTLRTNAKGVFQFRFAFGRSYRPGTYRLRVGVRTETAWPYLATTSTTKKIKIT